MGLLDGAAGLLFKIEADASGFEKEASKIDASVGNLSNRMSSFAGIATIAGAGILAVTSAAVTGSIALFRLAQAASEYGSEIFDATEKTGLAAETISSLKVAADQSGTSLDSVTSGLAKFAKTIGEANDGSDQAQAKLKKIGVTSLDLDTALSQALATIAKYPPGFQQMTAAQAAFGKSGADLLPFIKSFDGNLPGLIAKCKELGLTLSNADARAADEFGDTLDTLSAQLGATGRQFALGFMPAVTQSMAEISTSMIGNQNVAREWGQTLGDVLRGTVQTVSNTQSSLDGFFTWLGQRFYSSIEDAKLFGDTLKNLIWMTAVGAGPLALANAGAEERQAAARREANVVRVTGDPGTFVNANRGRSINFSSGGTTSTRAPKDDSERLAREAAAIAARELRAKIDMAENLLAEFQKQFSDAIEKTVSELPTDKLFSDEEMLALQSGFGKYLEQIQRAEKALFALQNQQRSTMTDAEKDLLTQQQRLEKEKSRLDVLKEFNKLNTSLSESEKKYLDDISDRLDLEIRQKKELLELEQKRRVDLPGVPLPAPTLSTEGQPAPGNAFTDTMDWLTDPGKNGAVMATMERFAQGLGNIIQNLILMGTAGPNAMRKVTASVLASVAAQAAVQAIMFTAYGIAALTPWGAAVYGPAAPWFKAALVMASVAAVTGGLGRAAAGNAFSGETSGSGAGGFGSESDSGNRPGLKFTETFNGFGDSLKSGLDSAMRPVREVVGAMKEELGKFRETFGVATAGDVVMAGAGAASGAIFDAHLSAIKDDGGRSTELKRGMGDW